ncbi:hypothetical protein PVK06_009554 [Gossypium arboreum]|uniref:FACT complex subunit SSRP1 n=1 Tax=Gossypium arboreum TaxID=29729 RepID=A0ABR0QNP3_GOSAR|nr:hypothetical protein PVK06_009554 [Gossypium arboreum]
MEISFYIPNTNTQFVGDENRHPVQVFREKIMLVADVGTGVEEAVVTFEGIAILIPRGRYSVKLHLSFLRLQGQANDFKIQYSSVVCLFLLPKIDYVEFERHAAYGSNMHYFDLLIRLKTEQENLFRNIQRNEYQSLFDFISSKDSVVEILQNDDDDAVDPHLERIKNEAGVDESDEEDEDFVIDKDDGGSPTDDFGEEESDASESGDEKEKPAKKDQRKEATVAVAASSSKESKKKGREGQDDGKKKKRKKKDINAPKRAITGFFYFSQVEREKNVVTMRTLKNHLDRTNSLPFVKCIADFHLLLFPTMSHGLGFDVLALAACVSTETTVPEGYQLLIESMANTS